MRSNDTVRRAASATRCESSSRRSTMRHSSSYERYQVRANVLGPCSSLTFMQSCPVPDWWRIKDDGPTVTTEPQ